MLHSHKWVLSLNDDPHLRSVNEIPKINDTQYLTWDVNATPHDTP